MTERTKRAIYIVAFILSCAVIMFGLYVAFFRSSAPPTEEEPSTTIGGNLPTAGEGTPSENTPGTGGQLPPSNTTNPPITTTLTSSSVQYPTLSGNGVGYYDENDGRFYRIDEFGNVIALSSATFPKVESATWNENGSKAVLEFPDGSNIVYDFNTQTQVTLPNHWKDFQFSPNTDEIAAKSIGLDINNRYLLVSNSDGSRVKAIQPLGENADLVQISWAPNNQVIAFSDTSKNLSGGLNQNVIVPIGQNQENLKGISVEGRGFMPKWSPDGKTLLYSSHGQFSNEKPLLWIVSGDVGSLGESRRNLNLNTWADKCTYANTTTLYCAVPQGLPSNAALIRGNWRTAQDSLYKVDVTSGKVEIVQSFTEPTSMEQLMVDPTGTNLFFQNIQTGTLDKLAL